MIGSGCTGYQLVPEVAKVAGHTFVFQRTPSWVFDVPGYLDPFPPQVNWLDRNFPYLTNFVRFRTGLGQPARRDHEGRSAIDPDVRRPARHQRRQQDRCATGASSSCSASSPTGPS